MKLPVYPKLPSMKCDAGCGRCCGPVGCTVAEYDAVVAYAGANGITPARQGITCPYYQGGTCAVYPVRPMLCRLFGHTPKMVCANGHNVNVPEKRERRIMDDYVRAGATPDRAVFLHEAVYPGDDFTAMVMAYAGKGEE
jgi:Fe-S-cluster containining protein